MPKRLAKAEIVRPRLALTALLALALSGAGGVFFAGTSRAQDADSTGAITRPLEVPHGLPEETESSDQSNRIRAVHVAGLKNVDSTLVVSTFHMNKGDIYKIQSVRDGIKALYRLSLFEQVEVGGERTDDGIDIFIAVVESPRIAAVEFHGNKNVSSDKLQEKIAGTTGKVANGKTMNDVTTKLVEVYRDEGYPVATVQGSYTPAEKENERVLALEISEGSKIQVAAIHFVGNDHISESDLRGEMDTKAKGFWRKGHLQPDKLDADMDKIRTYYQRKGFRDIKVTDHQVTYGADGKTAEITITVDEGPIYTMGSTDIQGNKVLGTPGLTNLVKFKAGDRYNRQKIDESASEIGAAYADRGYLYAQVDPQERLDSTTVFVTYNIVEQEPSKVREIQITGNTRTKERVIRRQLYLYPGQKFDRSLLIRSQRELFQLGFFQDVQVDFRPIPDSYDVDLILNVQEKAVGTASAGAGFSSQGGLTGFVELSHPNLFGNGQSVSLRLERGSRTENIELSFTEPWFLNTPTTLGADIFSNSISREVGTDQRFDIRRTGGALRLSRPIPHVPYARGFLTYNFERTTGSGQTFVDENYVYLSQNVDSTGTNVKTTRHYDRVVHDPDPIRIDPSARTASSMVLGLSRNSTDHPLYPHTGMQSTITGETSGKIFQGDVNFQKYTLDNKAYLKLSPLPKSLKPAMMFRMQLGGIGFFGEKEPLRNPLSAADSLKGPQDRLYTVESLELFRLGGTSTGNVLRGYSDYEVVPHVQTRKITTTTLDSVIVRDRDGNILSTEVSSHDSTGYAYDTYPGGRYFSVLTLEQQFLIAEPLHGLLFAEVGGTWNSIKDVSFSSLHRSMGVGVRMEIPLLGLVGFDYAYGFDRLDRNDPPEKGGGKYNRGGWQGHLQFGRIF